MPDDIDIETDADVSVSGPVSDNSSRRISGKVVDENGMPIIGASVSVVQDSLNTTVTNIDGRFKLLINEEKPTIRNSYIGYETGEIPVLYGTTEYAIAMTPSQSLLDEVVVIGYG
ncbi:MAG: carboxypeptidase-like regulatory domain-containing protein, partial [Duncaniella sp.]|nr:carboxypeptidase-like regulatory domain-containing protein [Duncaniella sp.]